MRGSSITLPILCRKTATVAACVRIRSPLFDHSKPAAAITVSVDTTAGRYINSSSNGDTQGDSKKISSGVGRRIMVVVDSSSSSEANKSALQWALSHAVQKHDALVLVTIAKPSKTASKVLRAMKKICQARIPELEVESITVAMQEQMSSKGQVIVEEAKKQGVSLLVLGQQKKKSSSIAWGFLKRRSRDGSSSTGGRGRVVDYCVQNAPCMAIAVRRKSRRAGGGYLITTRKHKNFWLLA